MPSYDCSSFVAFTCYNKQGNLRWSHTHVHGVSTHEVLIAFRSIFKYPIEASPLRNICDSLCYPPTCSIVGSRIVDGRGNKQVLSEKSATSLPPLDETEGTMIHSSFSLHAQALNVTMRYPRTINQHFEYGFYCIKFCIN